MSYISATDTCFASTQFNASESCCCPGWDASYGTDREYQAQNVVSWMVFAVSCTILIFYGLQYFRAIVGWEEVYVCIVEVVVYLVDVYWQQNEPATLFLASGRRVMWIRYVEWLLTCPVILIHISNMTGAGEHDSHRTMKLLVSDVGCIVFGITAAMITGPLRIVSYLMATAYWVVTYYLAAQTFAEHYADVPEGTCKKLVMICIVLYYVSWTGYPILFLLGPEGFGSISYMMSCILHSFNDLFSKNLWGFTAHFLRIKVHEHMTKHGQASVKQKKLMVMTTEGFEVVQPPPSVMETVRRASISARMSLDARLGRGSQDDPNAMSRRMSLGTGTRNSRASLTLPSTQSSLGSGTAVDVLIGVKSSKVAPEPVPRVTSQSLDDVANNHALTINGGDDVASLESKGSRRIGWATQ